MSSGPSKILAEVGAHLFFSPKDGCNMFLWNVRKSLNYMLLQPRSRTQSKHSSGYPVFKHFLTLGKDIWKKQMTGHAEIWNRDNISRCIPVGS
jgi:hypothetical protein